MITGASQVGHAVALPDDPEARRRILWRQAWEDHRDQWGRPYVAPPGGGREVGYRRASKYGAPLEDATRMTKWKMRQVARGVARREDIQLAVTRAEVELDTAPEAARRALDDLADQAMDVVESSAKASIGTSLHHVLELLDRDQDPGHVPERWRPDVAAYQRLRRGFRVLSAEEIVVRDDHRVAGTYDRAVEALVPIPAPDGTVIPAGSVLIADLKTSQSMRFAGAKFAVQVWAYATGTLYDPIKRARIPWGHAAPRDDWAVIFHVGSGSGQAALYWVDLTEAALAAEQAREVYEWRNRRGKASVIAGSVVEDFTLTCEHAATRFDLAAAAERAKAAGAWTEILRQRLTRRWHQLQCASEDVEALT